MEERSRDEAPTVGRAKRLLVIDDEARIGDLLRRIVGRGWDTVACTEGRDAIARLAAGERFDCVLCDVNMPTMGGRELFAAVGAIAPEQSERIVFMTGGSGLEDVEAFLTAVGNPRIKKPFAFGDIRDAVEAMARVGDEATSGVWRRG